MNRIASTIGIVIFTIFSLNPKVGNASWCIPLKDLAKPELITARAILSYYKEPWTEWLQGFITKRLQGSELSDLKTVYKITSANLLFVDEGFKPKSSMKAIIREFYRDLPNREQVEQLMRDLENARQDLFAQYPSGVNPDVVTLCAHRDPDKAFFVSEESLERDLEHAVIQWATRQKKAYEHLAEKGVELDSLFTASLINLLKKKTPYHGFSWVYFVDNETTMVNFLKYDGLNQLQVYRALREALPKYEKLADSSQITVSLSERSKSEPRNPSIVTIQKRLIQEGYLDGSPTGILDERTKEAIIAFQRAHFVTPNGTLGSKTIEKMNLPYSQKADWIRLSLEGIAEMPIRIYSNFIWVNIPTFSLEYYEGGRLVSRHKVIVGRADGKEMRLKDKIIKWNNTLPLISEIKSVVLNPRWYVPERIRIELGKEAANDEFYFQKRGFRTLDSTYSWGEPRLYQLPGGKNPLGKVKFLFDNPYGFYLHDTPEQHLFKRASRAISHGCIRVEKALDLAKEILQRDNPRRAEQIETYLKRPDQTYITLERPIPIVVTYFPVSVAEDGLLEFGGDPYAWSQTNGFKGFFYVKGDQGV
ncbi:MAG: L,D-transpeptidase family protein [Syntrophobacterales bacterium]|nr:L,D-transpeptidase family protein [Syntrophobacterales bacterium]